MIESTNNEKIKEYSKLKQKKYRDLTSKYIVEGKHLVEEAKNEGLVEIIYSTNNYPNSTKVSLDVMKKLSDLKTPPDVLAIVKKKENKEIKGNILILDNIQNPGNLGTIIRSSVAFNIDTIIASKETVDPYNIKVLRASEGMFFKINYIEENLEDILPILKEYNIYTTNVEKGRDISNVNIRKPYALIIGNEGSGVRKEISKYANETLYIPMNNQCESLNVGVATSIILYELNKRKQD